jgi:hypothetical protein
MAARGPDLAADSAEVGSFRDPDSRVFVTQDGVFRLLSEQGLVLETRTLFGARPRA